MRILHVTHDMNIGGTEQVIKQIVMGVDKTRFTSDIVCLDNTIGDVAKSIDPSRVKLHKLARRPGFDTTLIRELRSLIKREAIDIVHCHQYTPYVYGVLAGLLTRTPVIFTEHGRFYPDRYSWKRRLVNPLLGFATRAFVSISAATRDALIDYEWFPARRISVIYNGIHGVSPDSQAVTQARQESSLEPDHYVYGTVSRLDTIKNQTLLINAFAKVHAQHPHTRLLLVGDGPERDTLESLVASLKLGKAVVFTGFRSDPEPWFGVINAFVLCSLSEGTSMTLLEAQSARLPCIVTAVGGNTEIITNEQNGLVVASDNVEALSEAMLRVVQDPALATRLSDAGFEVFSTRFQRQKMIDAYEKLYESAYVK